MAQVLCTQIHLPIRRFLTRCFCNVLRGGKRLWIAIYTYVYIACAWTSTHSYIYIYIYIYIYQRRHTPLDYAVEKEKEEAAAVLRAHGALHSLLFAARVGMMDEVAARIAAGQDVNARNEVICLCVGVWVCGGC